MPRIAAKEVTILDPQSLRAFWDALSRCEDESRVENVLRGGGESVAVRVAPVVGEESPNVNMVVPPPTPGSVAKPAGSPQK